MSFKAGVSGNPEGRPKGTGFRQQLFNSLVGPHREQLFNTAINLALDGNETLLRLFLERMMPARPTDNTVNLDIAGMELTKAEAVISLGENIFRGVASAELTPDEARVLMGSLDTLSKLIETNELAQRVEAIEKALKRRK